MADELVYVPQVGFRRAHALGTRENFVLERGARLFIAGITPTRDGCRLQFTVSGLDVDLPVPASDCVGGECFPYRRFEDPVAIRDDKGRDVSSPLPRWSVGGFFRRTADGSAMLNYGTVLAPLRPDVSHVAVDLSGVAGEWHVEIPVAPAELLGPLGAPIDAWDTHHGVTIAARTVARSTEMTAIELEAYLDPPDEADQRIRRRVRGIGASLGARLCGDQIVLRDETGAVHFEDARGPMAGAAIDQGGKGHREVAIFPGLSDDMRSVALEIENVWINERSDESITVPLPGETDIRIAGYDARVTVTRLPGVYTAGSVRVEIAPRDLEADKQLVFIEGVNADVAARTGMRIEHSIGKRPVVEVPEPTGKATELTLRAPVVQLRGPWRLTIPLPR